MNTNKFLYCAIDFKDIKIAEVMIKKIAEHIGGLKLGLEFFISNGVDGVNYLKKFKLPIFLDLKLHDIPNTVNEAVNSALITEPDYLSIHISGGVEMMRLVSKNQNLKKTKIIGITMLTSLQKKDLTCLGIDLSPEQYVYKLVDLAYSNGLHGVVCAPNEVKDLKNLFPNKFKFITPGIRLDSNKNDQKRVASPGEAIKNGSDILIIGRPITQAKNPIQIIKKIKENIDKVLV